MTASVSFKYLDLGHIGGRGGTLRFFLLANGIPYTEDLYQYNDSVWGVEKKRLVESGENPCGTVPVAYTEDGQHHLSQHISMARYFARINKLDSGDAWKDYVQDVVADEYQGFRNIWVEKSFASTDEQKAEYASKTVPELLTKFEALYKKYKTTGKDQAYLSTSPSGSPLWGDTAMFSILYDHIQLGHLTEETLTSSYPHLSAMYKTFIAIPAVAEWIERKKPTTS